jgi:superfamily II DNA helicase RecQ
MADQNMHLKEKGVPSEMLNASTSRQDANLIMKRLLHSGSDKNTHQSSKEKGKGKISPNDHITSIKLCYVHTFFSFLFCITSRLIQSQHSLNLHSLILQVTPEKIAKSKTFVSTLQKVRNLKTRSFSKLISIIQF